MSIPQIYGKCVGTGDHLMGIPTGVRAGDLTWPGQEFKPLSLAVIPGRINDVYGLHGVYQYVSSQYNLFFG